MESRALRIAREIIEQRQQNSDQSRAVKYNVIDNSSTVFRNPVEKVSNATEYLHSIPDSESTYQGIVLSDGSKRYLKKKNSTGASENFNCEQVLDRPIQDLIKEAEVRQINHLANSARLAEMEIESSGHTELWVDKYSPSSFPQLLSPEKVNREVLKALKAWDQFVFKRALPNEKREGLLDDKTGKFKTQPRKSGIDTKDNEFPSRDFEDKPYHSDNDNDFDNEDFVMESKSKGSSSTPKLRAVEDKRPKQRLILLSGAPGTGKTTLAHILAKHCGYRPLEVNASDERTAEKVKSILFEATQSNTINGDNRPNCVIFDEIDGIDNKKAIDALIDIAKAPLTPKNAKKTPGSFPLTRPVICICNDMYAPVLRDLRLHAVIFNFQAPAEIRLVNRLKHICTSEELLLSTSALTQLCNSTGNDIRSSINTLQFASAESAVDKRTHNRADALHKMLSKGLKDEQFNIFTVLGMSLSSFELGIHVSMQKSLLSVSVEDFVFKGLSPTKGAMKAQSNSFGNSNSSENGTSLLNAVESMKKKINEIDELMRIVDEFGDSQLILSGLFENRLNFEYSDSLLVKTDFVSEWISSMDTLESKFSDGFHNNRYIGALAASMHLVASSDKRVKLEFPKKDREMYYKLQHNTNIMRSLQESMQGHNVPSFQTLSLDFISYIMSILNPKLKASSVSSLSESDKHVITQTARLMMSYGLSFSGLPKNYDQRDRSTVQIKLDPPIGEVVSYSNADISNYERISNEMIIAIITEIKKQQAEKLAVKAGDVSSEAATTPSKALVALETVKKDEPQVIKMASMELFCTKKRGSDSLTTTIAKPMPANKKQKIFFRFNQGFSNAVKRTVNIRDFI